MGSESCISGQSALLFDRSDGDPVRLRNVHVVMIMFINSCKGTPLEIVQRSEAPNDAWQNLESHYRAKRTREILRLLHDFDGKPMQPGENPFQFIMETDRLAADLHKLGDRSVTELRNV